MVFFYIFFLNLQHCSKALRLLFVAEFEMFFLMLTCLLCELKA